MLKKRYTIFVKGNQFGDQYVNGEYNKYTAWRFYVTIEGTYITKISNIKYLFGLNDNDITPRLRARTKEFWDLEHNNSAPYPEYLEV